MDGLQEQLYAAFGSNTPVVVSVAVGVVVGAISLLLCCFLGLCGSSGKTEKAGEERETEDLQNKEGQEGDGKAKKPKGKGFKSKPSSKKVTLPSHPLLAGEFKGHTGSVLSLDMESNGKYLASCSEDRTLRLWHMKTLGEKEHKYSRKNINLDHATHIKFSPDGTAVVTTLAVANTVNVYRMSKPKGGSVAFSDEPVVEFSLGSSDAVIAMGIASTGKYIMTCTETTFTVWTVKGELLTSVQTHQAPNTCAAVSPCGKFVACAGFTPDVKLWEVDFKADNFNQVVKAMELKGHRASVLSFSFSGDSHKAATVSKDGTWKLWDIDVRYQLSEDPKLIKSMEVPELKSCHSTQIAISPDARVVAVAISKEDTSSIYLYPTATDSSAERIGILDIHRELTDLCWEPTSLYLVSSAADRHIRVWHNSLGQKELIHELKAKLPKASSEPLKRRMQQQISEAEKYLKSIGQF